MFNHNLRTFGIILPLFFTIKSSVVLSFLPLKRRNPGLISLAIKTKNPVLKAHILPLAVVSVIALLLSCFVAAWLFVVATGTFLLADYRLGAASVHYFLVELNNLF